MKFNTIATVRGPIDKGQFGIIDMHNHLWVKKDAQKEKKDNSSFAVDNFFLIEQELRKFKNLKIDGISDGNISIVDSQPGGCGRNGKKLLKLSEITGINIIAITGFHKRDYYDSSWSLWKMDRKAAIEYFKNEIEDRLEESKNSKRKIRAGAIKVAFTGILKGQYKILTEAAIEASLLTGAPLVVHTDRGKGVEGLVEFLEKKKFPLHKALICHIDKRADIGLHKYLADKSIYLEYDTFNRPKYNPENNVWPLLQEMIESGYSKSIMIGTDLAENTLWTDIKNNGGLASFFEKIILRLFSVGVEKIAIENIFKNNGKEFLCLK